MVIMIIRSISLTQVTENPILTGYTIMPALYHHLSSLSSTFCCVRLGWYFVSHISQTLLPAGLGGRREEGFHFYLSVCGSDSPAEVNSGIHFSTPFGTPSAPSPCLCRGTGAHQKLHRLPYPLGRCSGASEQPLWGV